MTDLPQDTPELETAKGFDSARLIAAVRRGDDAETKEAYRVVFGSPMGRVVLLHALSMIGGVGKARGFEREGEAGFNNGKAYAVLTISELAGFDHVAVAAAGMTQIIEGANYEHAYGSQHTGNPTVAFGDPADASDAAGYASDGLDFGAQ